MPTGTYKVAIYNLLGQTVFSKTIQIVVREETKAIDFGNTRVAAGAYEVQVTNSTGISMKREKVVVE
jgi:hypothetical protein